VDYQLGKSVALHRGHLRISWPAARLARWPWETVTTRESSSRRARSGHGWR